MDTEERFNALYRTHATAVLRYACRRTDPDTARDVVAETFLVAWRKLAAVPADPAQAEPWLYGVARRVLANADRSAQRTLRLAARLWDEGPGDQVPDPAAAISERQRICQALGQLSDLDQEVLRLMGWEELQHRRRRRRDGLFDVGHDGASASGQTQDAPGAAND